MKFSESELIDLKNDDVAKIIVRYITAGAIRGESLISYCEENDISLYDVLNDTKKDVLLNVKGFSDISVESFFDRLNKFRYVLTAGETTYVDENIEIRYPLRVLALIFVYGFTEDTSLKVLGMTYFIARQNAKASTDYDSRAIEILVKNPFALIDIEGSGLSYNKLKQAVVDSRVLDKNIDYSLLVNMVASYLKNKVTSEVLQSDRDYLLREDFVDMFNQEFGMYGLLSNAEDVQNMTGLIDTYFEYSDDKSRMIPVNVKKIELGIAKDLNRLSKTDVDDVEVEDALKMAQDKFEINLNERQQEAVKMAVSSPVSILCGPAGTGKTTVLRSVIEVLLSNGFTRNDIELCAPTGKAAKNLSDVTNMSGAQTIHRLLGIYSEKARPSKRIEGKFLIVDESSMVGLKLFSKLVSNIPTGVQVLFVGDDYQLPPVKDISVYRSMLDSGKYPITRLEHVYRQDKGSEILDIATDVRLNNVTPKYLADKFANTFDYDHWINDGQMHWYFVANSNVDSVIDMVLSGFDRTSDFSVIAQRNATVAKCNILAQSKYNSYSGSEVFYSTTTDSQGHSVDYQIKKGDKVLITKNNTKQDVFNGEQYYFDGGMNKDAKGNISFRLKENDSSPISKIIVDESATKSSGSAWSMKRNIGLGYALTVHKAQGSTIENVLLVMDDSSSISSRELLYTALTRAGKNVYIITRPNTFLSMCQRSTRVTEGLEFTEILRKNG